MVNDCISLKNFHLEKVRMKNIIDEGYP